MERITNEYRWILSAQSREIWRLLDEVEQMKSADINFDDIVDAKDLAFVEKNYLM